jgi:hypothetical protein
VFEDFLEFLETRNSDPNRIAKGALHLVPFRDNLIEFLTIWLMGFMAGMIHPLDVDSDLFLELIQDLHSLKLYTGVKQ